MSEELEIGGGDLQPVPIYFTQDFPSIDVREKSDGSHTVVFIRQAIFGGFTLALTEDLCRELFEELQRYWITKTEEPDE